MKIKICGIRKKQDMDTCENASADLIGFINIKRSKRMVKIDAIKGLTSSMKDKNKAVLVIEPHNMADAKEKINKSGLNTIQLHSLSSNEICSLKEEYENNSITGKTNAIPHENTHLTVIRALGLSEVIDTVKKQEIQNFVDVCDYLLFDYQLQGKTGGTGRQIPTEIAIEAAKIAKSHNKNIKLFLAGGMNFERIKNEGKLLEKYFDCFDVNSGVEDEPGVKNIDKIYELMKFKAES